MSSHSPFSAVRFRKKSINPNDKIPRKFTNKNSMQIKKLKRKVEIEELNLQQKRIVEKEVLETAKRKIDDVVEFYEREKKKIFWSEESEENKEMNANLDEWLRDACRTQNMLRQQLLD